MKHWCCWLLLAALAALGAGPAVTTAATPFAVPPIDGWTIAGPPQVFSPETLYDYIDGGSDLYLKYDFEELQVVEYRKGPMSVSAEVYRHRDSNHAFGIYSQERVPSAEFLALGAQGYYEHTVCNFIQERYYVKLTGENTGTADREILLGIARRISQDLPASSGLPSTVSAFPRDGKKPNAEKFIAKDFLGYGFLHAGFTAEYERGGRKFQLFVIAGDSPKDAEAMLGQYLKQVKQTAPLAEGPYELKDPYHGDLVLFWKGKEIWGGKDLKDPSLRKQIQQELQDAAGRRSP
jgi:hypothetical protein